MGDIQLETALSITGWMSPIELEWLARTSRGCSLILEIGCLRGRSTRAICDNTSALVVAVDPWDGIYLTDKGHPLFDCALSWAEFKRNLASVENLVTYRGTSREFFKTNHVVTFDFIFIDGDHHYNEVRNDIIESLRILKDGGILAGHDYTHPDWPGVKEAVDEFFPEKEIVDSIWSIQKY